MNRALLALITAGCCGLLPEAAAQPLADPTRPPAASVPGSSEEPAAAAGPRLQSILLSSSRKIAVIDGRPVALGSKAGSAVLVRISPSEVVLREGDAETTLTMFPGVDKKTRAAVGSVATGGRP